MGRWYNVKSITGSGTKMVSWQILWYLQTSYRYEKHTDSVSYGFTALQHAAVRCVRDSRECGHSGEVVVDVEHGGVQQRVDVLQTLQPGLQAPPPLCFHLPQLVLRQPWQRRRRRRHWRHWRTGQDTSTPTSPYETDWNVMKCSWKLWSHLQFTVWTCTTQSLWHHILLKPLVQNIQCVPGGPPHQLSITIYLFI